VRIATPLAPVAGANWGTVAVPRIGSEVLIDFLDGNIDRPVVIGSVYNGQGAQDAQNNQVAGAGAATGNAPAWFWRGRCLRPRCGAVGPEVAGDGVQPDR
jgi:type VI secretion system secreted protein VgrG